MVVETIALGAVSIAVVVAVHDQLRDRRAKRQERWKMKEKHKHDELARVFDDGDDDPEPVDALPTPTTKTVRKPVPVPVKDNGSHRCSVCSGRLSDRVVAMEIHEPVMAVSHGPDVGPRTASMPESHKICESCVHRLGVDT